VGTGTLRTPPEIKKINPDILNMSSPPSLTRTRWLSDLCSRFNLLDPYRAFHPTRRDFSYFPKGQRKNRSRIDFFLMSQDLLSKCKSCDISPWLSVNTFDHKSIFLDFGNTKSSPKLYINRTIINNPRTDDVVLGAYADTYLSHAVDNETGPVRLVHNRHQLGILEEQKVIVGNFLQMIIDYNSLVEREIREPDNNLIPLLIAAKSRDLDIQRERIWPIDAFSNFRLSCDNDFFFEALSSNIKGSVISFQTWVRCTDNLRKSILVDRLNSLRSNYDLNFDEISDCEKKLNDLVNTEVMAKVKQMKIFSCLNSEKPTPVFLNLARSSNVDSKLSAITKPDGSPFENQADRNDHIVEYYEDIYNAAPCSAQVTENCIKEFLGRDIIEHPVVRNSILTEAERDSLDAPLSLEELDQSINKCNLKSAPGIDGLSNIFIKKYWHYFRVPLHRYALSCFDKSCLTTNFRSACIKLIPKKGEISSIKNWRPISLLSNMYKILSRAINNRLNKVVNRICTRAQKGFNNRRYTQECLINVLETIQHCHVNNINGAVVAVDMAKAFDTLSHDFLRRVFKFYNFGPIITRWLTLLGENRQACILLDDGSYSRSFSLGRGRAQGDNISPNTFNFGEQILILKIELDPAITGIWKSQLIPLALATNCDPFFMSESRWETSKNESLADDNTTMMLLDESNLRALRKYLDDFASISGLRCNYDKTMVMPVGTGGPPPADMHCFLLSNKITLLGLDITNDIGSISDAFLKIRDKIVNIILFWERFRLSLTGRISIVKTLIIPQLNYLGCILTPDNDTLDQSQTLIDEFVLNGQNMSKDRRYLPPEMGGLGIFNLHDFLIAQKCSWVKRADNFVIDNWRLTLKMSAPNYDLSLLRSRDVDPFEHPVLFEIAWAYEFFIGCFAQLGNNFRKVNIFRNAAIMRWTREWLILIFSDVTFTPAIEP
jgi:hypothetical protein